MTGLRAGNRRCISQSSPASAARILEVLKRIACQENRQRQFEADANGGVGPPKISPDNGVGIFQITNTTQCPDPFTRCPNALFSWPANIPFGVAKFKEAAGAAKRYPAQLKATGLYRMFITNTVNPAREKAGLKPIPGFPAPQFTTVGPIGVLSPLNQLLRDAVRGYNGYGPLPTPPIAFGLVLHEFVINQIFLENVPDSQLSTLNTNPNVWRETDPSAFRSDKKFKGNSKYVEDVALQSPACGN